MKFNLKNVFLSVGIFAFTLALVGVFSTAKVEASTITSVGTCTNPAAPCNWTDGTTWGGGSAPAATDVVIISATDYITGTTITTTSPGTITNNGNLTVTTDLTGDGAFTNATGSTLTLVGASTISGVLTATANNTVNYTGAAQTLKDTASHTYYNLNLSGSLAKTMTGITTITGNFSMSGSATATTFLTTIGGALDISGTAAMTTGASLTVTGTSSVGAGTSLTNAATFTLTAPTTAVAGTLTNNGIFTVATALTGAGTVVNNASTSTLNIGQSGFPGPTITATAADNTVVYSAGSVNCKATAYSILNFTGSGGAIVCALTGAKDITLSNSGATTWSTSTSIPMTGTLTVGANVTLTNAANMTLTAPTLTMTGAVTNNGILTVDTALSGAGILTNIGTLNIGGTSAGVNLVADSSTNTVNYYKAGDQTVYDPGDTTDYYNLSLTGSGAKSMAALVIGGTFTVNGPTATLTGASTSYNIILGSVLARRLSWGATTSSPVAVNKSNTYFTSGSTGKITPTTGRIITTVGDINPDGSTTTSSSTTTTTPTSTVTTTTTTTTTPTPDLIITAVPNAPAPVEPGCSGGNKFNTANGNLCVNTVVAESKTYNLGTVTLKNGSKGEAVKELQRFLNDKLNLGLALDGKLGPKTIAVIKKWQKDNGLVADGMVGPKTKALINK